MSYNNKKLGAFIIPTGVGATIGGYAGDAGAYVRKFAQYSDLIVNPNVVNAGCFSSITPNMYYTEGFTLDRFFKNEINLVPKCRNKIGIIYDKAIPNDVLNIHINTQNAVKTVYGTNVIAYEITEKNVGVEFYINKQGISVGEVKNISALDSPCEKLIKKGCDAIAIVCLFNDAETDNENYAEGSGVDPVGGVEAIISHYISKKYNIPCAHSPAFEDYAIYPKLVNQKSSAEYITPTFLPCILLGLEQTPQISTNKSQGINIKNLDYLIMPHNCLGSIPVFEAIKNNIPVYSIMENKTELNITKDKLYEDSEIIEIPTYDDLLEIIINN